MNLALFFTRNFSLELWVEMGIFDREKLIYERHLKTKVCEKILWVTYGENDKKIAEDLKARGRLHPDIHILPKPGIFVGKAGNIVYSLLIPFIHFSTLRKCHVLKTNQIDGSWAAVVTKWLMRKPLVTRCGYSFCVFAKRRSVPRWKRFLAYWAEYIAYHAADHIIVASDHDVRLVRKYFHLKTGRVSRLYNYVDTSLFKPAETFCDDPKIVFVGRLIKQKNLKNLISALRGTNWQLDIYGEGPLEEKLNDEIRIAGINARLCGVVPNDRLPEIFKNYQYFVLPSYYEGMPKTLIEAMACGLVCLATRAAGNTEVIANGVNGYFIEGKDDTAIRRKFEEIIGQNHASVRQSAHRRITEEFSLDAISAYESDVLLNLNKDYYGLKLGLFFTRNMSLGAWIKTGLFDREKLIYERHLNDGTFDRVYWLTYGAGDTELADGLKREGKLHSAIHLLPKPAVFKGKIGNIIYSLFMPIYHYGKLRRCHLLKTNQIDGSWAAVMAKWFTGKPLITRSGYLFCVAVKRRNVPRWKRYTFYWAEYLSYLAADRIIVTSRYNVRLIQKYFKARKEKISMIYNYVDTNLFKAEEPYCKERRIIFVGRLSPEKNLKALVEAFDGRDWKLDLYGDGDQREEIKEHIGRHKAKVELCGVIPNDLLPATFRNYQYFVLPSFYEGMPKTLIEAMACGVVCLATKTTGNTEVIEDNISGYLIYGTRPEDIRRRFEEIMDKDYTQIRQNATQRIRDHFSLDSAATSEREVFHSLNRLIPCQQVCLNATK